MKTNRMAERVLAAFRSCILMIVINLIFLSQYFLGVHGAGGCKVFTIFFLVYGIVSPR
jgi:hypothetical protein